MNIKTKLIALGGSAACIAGLVVSASGATGAYFSQTVPGSITGTTGQITATIDGGNVPGHSNEFAWTNMLPGVANTANVHYTNTSSNAENIYLTFPNDTALSALNDLGTYGEVQIYSSALGSVFHSTNLRDTERPSDTHGCLPYSNATGACNPLPNVVLIASNVAAGADGHIVFSFNYASKLTGPQGAAFNLFPASRTSPPSTSYVRHTDDTDAGHTGNGLPFAVVATQVNNTLTATN